MLLRLVSASLLLMGVIVTPAAAASPGLVEAMRRDFGLTEQQALTRIRQEAVATKIAPAAEKAAGSAFAGTWFDAGTGKLVVGLTDQARRPRCGRRARKPCPRHGPSPSWTP